MSPAPHLTPGLPPGRRGLVPEPPNNLEAEEYILGAMMISTYAIDAVSEVVDQTDFYRQSHGVIFKAILDLNQSGRPADPVTLAALLDARGGLDGEKAGERIRELATLVPATTNAVHHARIVREASIRRRLLTFGFVVQQQAAAGAQASVELIENAERGLLDIIRSDGTHDAAPIGATLRDTIREIEEIHEAGGREVTGVATGFKTIDELTSGLQAGNLVVIAGRPSMGKTALALAVASNVAVRQKATVAVFSMEMTRRELERRLLSSEADVEAQKINRGTMNREEWVRFVAASATLIDAPLLIDDSPGLRLSELRSKARRLKIRHPDLCLIIVDYLQLIAEGGGDNRVQQVSAITRSLKVMAGELGVPVVAMSQLSREVEKRHDKRPILSDLRESGSVEQDADVVMFVYRDEYYHPEDTDQEGIAEVNIAKQRNGPIGTAKLAFVKRYAKFSTLARSPD